MREWLSLKALNKELRLLNKTFHKKTDYIIPSEQSNQSSIRTKQNILFFKRRFVEKLDGRNINPYPRP